MANVHSTFCAATSIALTLPSSAPRYATPSTTAGEESASAFSDTSHASPREAAETASMPVSPGAKPPREAPEANCGHETGTGFATPVPLMSAVAGPEVVPSVSVAARVPDACGANATPTAHCAPGCTTAPVHPSLRIGKSANRSTRTSTTVSEAPPVFWSQNVLGAVVAPTPRAPKAEGLG